MRKSYHQTKSYHQRKSTNSRSQKSAKLHWRRLMNSAFGEASAADVEVLQDVAAKSFLEEGWAEDSAEAEDWVEVCELEVHPPQCKFLHFVYRTLPRLDADPRGQ
jgi:hypothetical protein